MTEAQKIRRRETDREWYRQNRAKCKADFEKWRIENPDKVAAAKARQAERRIAEKADRVAALEAWRKANPAEAERIYLERLEIGRAKKLGYDKAYRERHPEKKRESTRLAVQKWKLAHPDALRVSRKARVIPIRLRKHGLHIDQYNQLLESQNDACALCKKEFPGRGPHIDHDHTTGKVRGLLCNACNSMIGFAKDSETTLLAAVEYLRLSRRADETIALSATLDSSANRL